MILDKTCSRIPGATVVDSDMARLGTNVHDFSKLFCTDGASLAKVAEDPVSS